MFRVIEILLMILSIVNILWGPPNPLKAVLEATFVRHKCPLTIMLGILYALSILSNALFITAADKSNELPALLYRSTIRAMIFPSD